MHLSSPGPLNTASCQPQASASLTPHCFGPFPAFWASPDSLLSPCPLVSAELVSFLPSLGCSGLSLSLGCNCSYNWIIFMHMGFGDTIVGNPSVVQVCGAECEPESGPGAPGGWEATENINTHPKGQALNPTTRGNPPGHPLELARAHEPLRAFCWQRRR